MTNIEKILEFLNEKQGYRKEGKKRLFEIVLSKGVVNQDATIEDCAEALRKFNSEDVEEITYNKEPDEIPDGFEVKSMWQGADGRMLYSYKRKENPEVTSHLDSAIEKLQEYSDSRAKRVHTKSDCSGIKVHSLADLHIGAHVKDLINTPDYDITIIAKKLNQAAQEINAENNKENHIFILGDLIESFTGLNHINSWKSLELHGANVLILAYELIIGFLESIQNLECVYLVAGNHDRITSNNKEDQDGDIAKIIAYFLSKKMKIQFHSRVLSVVIDNINYILHHGDKIFAKGDVADIILAHKKGDCFSVVLSGHLHTRGKKERSTQIVADDKKYRAYINPSIFTGNQYSEDLGFTSVAGYYSFENRNNLPRLFDNPLV
jgi:UDP-2,3-diacylglucosamine pyrophosphatase LpxH